MIKKFAALVLVVSFLQCNASHANDGVVLIKEPPTYKSFRNLGSAARRLSKQRPDDIVGFFNDGAEKEIIVDYSRVQELFESYYKHAGSAKEIGNRIWTDQIIE